jgi:integrase
MAFLSYGPARVLFRRRNNAMLTEASAFLAASSNETPQTAAYFALALDTGARKGELHGLRWSDLDLDKAQVRIDRQMYRKRRTAEADFGETKTRRGRTVALGAQTVVLLRAHHRTQSELKMRNRTTYGDLDLVFAREWRSPGLVGGEVGDAVCMKSIAEDAFRRICKRAGVRKVKFHGLRHTFATLLLRASVPPHVVARRLGHAEVTTTLASYAHVLPDMSQDAAAKLDAVLHGAQAGRTWPRSAGDWRMTRTRTSECGTGRIQFSESRSMR